MHSTVSGTRKSSVGPHTGQPPSEIHNNTLTHKRGEIIHRKLLMWFCFSRLKLSTKCQSINGTYASLFDNIVWLSFHINDRSCHTTIFTCSERKNCTKLIIWSILHFHLQLVIFHACTLQCTWPYLRNTDRLPFVNIWNSITIMIVGCCNGLFVTTHNHPYW